MASVIIRYTVGADYRAANSIDVPVTVYTGANTSYTVTSGFAANGNQTLTIDNGVSSQTVDLGARLAALAIDFSSNVAPVVLTGGDGNDFLRGGSGADTINGGAGNDYIEGGNGVVNKIDGGSGNNTVTYEHYDYDGYSTGMDVDLTMGRAISFDPVGEQRLVDTLKNIQNVRGSIVDDRIWGGLGRNVLEGGPDSVGGDFYANADNSDFVSYLHSSAGVTVTLSNIANNVGGDAQNDYLGQFQNLYGSRFSDSMTGNGNANTIRGFGGADTISTGAGNDRVFISTTPTLVDGGSDFDVLNIVVEGASTPPVVLTDQNFQNFERVNVYDGARVDMSGVTQGAFIRAASTSGGGANIYGTSGNDRIYGGAGNDVLRGGAGNDTIRAGEANQTIEGGVGDDLIFVSTGTGASNPQDTFNMMMSGFGRDTIRGTATALSNDVFQVAGLGAQFSDLSFAKYGNGAIVTGAAGDPGDAIFFSNLTVDQAKGLNFRFDQSA